jgi:hypothetical protein
MSRAELFYVMVSLSLNFYYGAGRLSHSYTGYSQPWWDLEGILQGLTKSSRAQAKWVATQDTFLKASAEHSDKLLSSQKLFVKQGSVLIGTVSSELRDYWIINDGTLEELKLDPSIKFVHKTQWKQLQLPTEAKLEAADLRLETPAVTTRLEAREEASGLSIPKPGSRTPSGLSPERGEESADKNRQFPQKKPEGRNSGWLSRIFRVSNNRGARY